MNADDHLTQINNITDPDESYEDLIQAHDGLSADQSRQLNSRIILLMANQIADNRKLTELITLARTSLDVA